MPDCVKKKNQDESLLEKLLITLLLLCLIINEEYEDILLKVGALKERTNSVTTQKKTFPSSISACFDSVIKYFPRFSQSCLKITQIEWKRKENEVEKLNNINFTQLSA